MNWFFYEYDSMLFKVKNINIWKNVKEWLHTIVFVGVIYLACTTIFVEGYQIPSGSMEPTFHGDPRFLHGDRIFALKGISKFLPFNRGDIVIFISAEDQETFIVKRLVGLPGDRVQIKNGGILVNGKYLESSVFKKNTYYVPAFTQMPNGKWHYQGMWSKVPPIIKFETEYSIKKLPRPLRCFGQYEVTVPKDCFFVLGDNSASSNDSRYWGFVPMNHVLGKAALIWWPISRGKLLE